jgi:hypothetical protein
MIGVIIPAHNEEHELERCLAAIRVAAADAALGGEAVHVVVVLDSCSDGSRAIVERHALHSAGGGCVVVGIVVASRNVGAARAAGAACLLALGARWLASPMPTRASRRRGWRCNWAWTWTSSAAPSRSTTGRRIWTTPRPCAGTSTAGTPTPTATATSTAPTWACRHR